MKYERFIEEIAREVARIEAESELVEFEYNNYIIELQHEHNTLKMLDLIRQHRKSYQYDLEALKKKHKYKIANRIKARF